MRYVLTFLMLVLLSVPALAQDTVKQDTAKQDSGKQDPAKQDAGKADAGQQERLALAQKINQVNPVSRQIEASLLRVASEWRLSEKEKFQREMMAAMDIKAMEKSSAEALADTFTKEELVVMLDYYSKPEAAKITEKMPIYQGLVQPGISREIDRALMKLRTGYEAQFKNAPISTSAPATP